MNRGFTPSKIEVTDYRLGGAVSLKSKVIVPDGQWSQWLPQVENQSRDGFEPYACVSYAVKHAVEILQRQEFGDIGELSARYLAWATGTEQAKGNDPTNVCTYLGRNGDVYDADWPYPTPATDFYKTPPSNYSLLAKVFTSKYAYDNQWLAATPDAMMDALTRSPLTVAGFAWATRPDGIYYWPDGAQADHYFVLIGFSRNNYWIAFDTYPDTLGSNLKKIAWDYPFIQVKEHTLHAQVVYPSFWDKFVQTIRHICGLDGNSLGAARSPQWPQVQKAFIKEHPLCAVCDKKGTLINPLNVHHVSMFSKDPTRELDPTNLITLCRVHHFLFGHLDKWASENIKVREDAAEWRTKIQERP